MDLNFDLKKAKGYKSPSQIARVLTEDWCGKNLFCASCDNKSLDPAPDNTSVFDFVCSGCSETYQLKSRSKPLRDKVLDSAYEPMINAIKSNKTPNLFLLHYNPKEYLTENLIIVPRYFLSVSCIEPRKPLSVNARRAGWVGCNIVLKQLPSDGRISIIKERRPVNPGEVRLRYSRFKFLSDKSYDIRGWTADVLKALREMGKKNFTLKEAYALESSLRVLHPDNKHIQAKIRQQLQILRDRGVLRFLGNGRYGFLY
ncbi:MAG: DpnI domain-containing protein [Thermodesulfobacteriota bacterium]